jgi:cell division protein FtsI/penicillin-binding protein 2
VINAYWGRISAPRRSRIGRRAGSLLIAICLAESVAACTRSSAGPEVQAAQAFLDAVGSGQTGRAAEATDDPSQARAALAASQAGLGTLARATFRVVSSSEHGAHATVTFSAHWTVTPHTPPWAYTGHLSLSRQDSRWLVHWTPATEHPALLAGTHLAVRRNQPARAALLDSAGTPLFRPTAVVTVGIEPRLVRNVSSLAQHLADVPVLQSSAAEIASAVRRAAHPTDFVPVITLRRPAYQAIRSRIHSLPGTVFQSGTEDLGPTPGFGQPMLGRVAPANAEIAAASHGRVAADDETGSGGLQEAYDRVLSGSPGVQIGVVDDRTGAMTSVLDTLTNPRKGRPIRLTLDAHIQQTADNALASVTKPAAIVAIQPSTGKILADANSAAATYDLGLQGALPPGSTFKIATWMAAFSHDPTLTPHTLVPCPATTTVDGRVFINENRFSHPPIPISASFGYSCNTSAINEAMHLPDSAVREAARRLGLGATWKLPVPAFSGTLPLPDGQTEQAADAIGQGRVLVSPLMMALMAGAAATGHVRSPTINEAAPRRASRPNLPDRLVHDMTSLMKATVDLPGGTAHTLSSVPGLIGKTGTAEYGNARPPRTHTWFAGVRGDLAFAVFIYDGATHGGSALPVVARFLDGIGSAIR